MKEQSDTFKVKLFDRLDGHFISEHKVQFDGCQTIVDSNMKAVATGLNYTPTIRIPAELFTK